jgi:uncharacterized protein (TIGR00369 family)
MLGGVITDEPVRGRFAYLEHPGLLGLSGLEQMRRFQRREIPYGPIWYLAGTDFVDVAEGASTWRQPVTPWLQSAAGILTGGVMALPADAALGGALYATFPPATVLATSELSLHFLRPARLDSRGIVTRARLVQTGRSQGLSEGAIEDDDGRLLAHAVARNLIVGMPETPQPLPDEPIPWPEYEGPHPFERPAQGEVLPQETFDRMDGLEMMRAWERGDLPHEPLARLFGIDIVSVGSGKVACSMPASQWFTTAGGTFFGGVTALFADHALNAAVHTTVEAGTSYGTLDLKVNFLRPVIPDGRALEARATVVHRGRSIAVATAEVLTAEGKTAALANSSTMILPGRPWRPMEPAIPLDEAPDERDD